MLAEGLKPVYRTYPGRKSWSRIPSELINVNNLKEKIRFSFTFGFKLEHDRVFFAYSFPWSCLENSVNRYITKEKI